MSAPLKNRPPWPMKWIVLAIVLVIVPYTFITLRYRKEGHAFEPYEDLKARANTSRLLDAGYRRIPIVATRPADGGRAPGGAMLAPAPGGMPGDLRTTLVEPLQLPAQISGVVAAPTTEATAPYAIQATCTLPDERYQLAGADIFVRGKVVVIAPNFERLTGELTVRSRQSTVLLTMPAETLKPGQYVVILAAERASHTWPLEVK
ncbi:MAG: hypothetical protein ABIQ12_01165 [Opitutaceae bacterium]